MAALSNNYSHYLKLYFSSSQENGLCSVSVYHFTLPTQHTPVTVVYPHTASGQREPHSDQQLLSIRRELHRMFGLMEDRPYLRTINRQCFAKPGERG